MPNFRYTTYLVNQQKPSYSSSSSGSNNGSSDGNSTAAVVLGRRKLTPEVFQIMGERVPSLASQLVVVDRVGYLSHTFQNMGHLAEQQQSTTLEFNHYALPGESRMSFVVSPVIAPCLPQLSAHPSLQSLHDINRQFAVQQRRNFDEVEAQGLLISIINHLEKLNMINIKYDSAVTVQDKTQSKNRVSKIQTMADRQREKTQRNPGFDSEAADSTVKIGGLNVRAAKKPQLPDLPTERVAGSGDSAESVQKPLKKSIPVDSLHTEGVRGSHTIVSREETATTTSAAASEEGELSIEEQVSRMRALGYPDETIADLLDVSLDSIAHAAKPATATSTAPQPSTGTSASKSPTAVRSPIQAAAEADQKAVDIALDGSSQQQATQSTGRTAKGIIDLLTRFTQHRSGQQSATTTTTTATTTSTTTSVTAPSGDTTQSHPDVSRATLSSNPSAEERSTETDTETHVHNTDKSGLIIGGGLKLPAKKTPMKTTSSTKQAQTIVTSAQNSQRSTGILSRNQGTGTANIKQQRDSIGVRADQIKFPAIQTEMALLNSPRSFKCIDR